ncbi:hypothetical protein ACH5Y9_08230 [Methylomonas sp. BW4-1]|uniref:hypothetical protein n=1 Tax=Methylomonas sp. BW4-1 TaxID=3376685 RepID=UPI00404295A9
MESSQEPQNVYASFAMAWTAYVRPVIVFLVMSSIGTALFANGYKTAGVIVCLVALALAAFQVLSIRSVILYTNEDGVWVYSGILPWSKGTNGVKWRDLEDAVYFTGFLSWALKSYTVRIGHRFTKTREIVLPHIARGNLAVEHINQLHREVLAQGVA